MGLRRCILVAVKDAIDGLVSTDGRIINATNEAFDPFERFDDLPLFSVLPGPEVITVGLFGSSAERSMPVEVSGACYLQNETTFLDGEDIIEDIIRKLLSTEQAAIFASVGGIACGGFTITEIGPVYAVVAEPRDVDEVDDDYSYTFISMPVNAAFYEVAS